MTVQEIIDHLIQRVKEDPRGIQGVNGVFQFDISGQEGGTYQVRLGNENIDYTLGSPVEAKSIFQLSDIHFKQLFQGKLNPKLAVMSGKVKIKGDLAQAMKLQHVVKYYK